MVLGGSLQISWRLSCAFGGDLHSAGRPVGTLIIRYPNANGSKLNVSFQAVSVFSR